MQQEALVWAQVVMAASPEGHGSNFLCLSAMKSPVRCRHVPTEWPRRRGRGHGRHPALASFLRSETRITTPTPSSSQAAALLGLQEKQRHVHECSWQLCLKWRRTGETRVVCGQGRGELWPHDGAEKRRPHRESVASMARQRHHSDGCIVQCQVMPCGPPAQRGCLGWGGRPLGAATCVGLDRVDGFTGVCKCQNFSNSAL